MTDNAATQNDVNGLFVVLGLIGGVIGGQVP